MPGYGQQISSESRSDGRRDAAHDWDNRVEQGFSLLTVGATVVGFSPDGLIVRRGLIPISAPRHTHL